MCISLIFAGCAEAGTSDNNTQAIEPNPSTKDTSRLPRIADSARPSREEVRELARSYDLFDHHWQVNPHLQFEEGDISYWSERCLTKQELMREFEARQMVLRQAETSGEKIPLQGDLSRKVNLLRNQPFRIDVQGDAHYSRYNFTDVKRPYDGVDAWMELKVAYWPLDENGEQTRSGFSPYVSVIPVTTTESEFWWQRNCTYAVGIQLYPMDNFWFRNLRLYTTYGVREYFDKPSHESPQDEDFRFGFDYYKDNLSEPNNTFTHLIWTNLTYRSTNYSLSDYSAVLWEGNLKLGPKFNFNVNTCSRSILLPYGLVDWTYVPAHSDRWWENFVRIGAGVSFYPKVPYIEKGGLKSILDRFNIYAEVLSNASWLGDDAPGNVKETDWRIGISFSTFWY